MIVKNMREKEMVNYESDYGFANHKVKVYPNDEQDSYLMSELSNSDGSEKSDDEESRMQEVMDPAEIIEKFPEKSPIFMIGMKRRGFWIVQIMTSCFFGIFLNLGYTTFFQNNYLLVFPCLQLLGSFIAKQRLRVRPHSETPVAERDPDGRSDSPGVRIRADHELFCSRKHADVRVHVLLPDDVGLPLQTHTRSGDIQHEEIQHQGVQLDSSQSENR